MTCLIQNKRALETLAAWVRSGRFPHAIMIEGQKGSGRKTFARSIVKHLLCTGSQTPCGRCSHCAKIEKDIHPDVLWEQGEGGARSFHVDKVREIRSEAYVRPNEADAKVFILVETQEMTIPAQNALLKIMEEPPKGVYFLLICENREQMLPTIQSRATIITMEIPDAESAAEELARQAPGKPAEEYQRAAVQSGGNIGKALELLEDETAEERYQTSRKVYIHLLENQELAALSAMEDCHRNKDLFLERLALMRSFTVAMLLEGSGGYRFTPLQLGKIVDIIDEVAEAVSRNIHLLLLINMVCSRICATLHED